MENNTNNSLKACKACGEQVSKKAKKCPNCGQDQRSFFMRHKFITGVLVLIVISFLSSLGSDNTDKPKTTNDPVVAEDSVEKKEEEKEETKEEKKEENVAELEVSSAQLIEDYEANEVRADEQYKGKIVEVTGKVGNIGVTMNQKYITLTDGTDFSIIDLQCFFKDEKEIEKLKDLNKGDNVTVIGEITGQSINIGMSRCYLK